MIKIGDCLEIMRAMETASIDLVLTDPPFSSGTRRESAKGGIRNAGSMLRSEVEWFGTDSLTTDGFTWLIRSCAVQWQRLLKPGGSVLCFIDWRMMNALSGAIESADLRSKGLIVWDKTYFGMGDCFRNQHEFILHFSKGVPNPAARRDVGNVIGCKPVRNGLHPTEKPRELLEKLMSVVTKPGDVVLDPFAGSGSTLAAAKASGRIGIGIERDPRYVAITEERVGSTPAPSIAAE